MPRFVSCTRPSWAWLALPSSKLSMTGLAGSSAPAVRWRRYRSGLIVVHPSSARASEHHQPSWVIVKLIGLLIALWILPVLIMLNLLLYLVILLAAVQAIFG